MVKKMADVNGLLNDYIDQENLRFEGDRGVRDLEKLVEVLGYDSRFAASSIHNFLSDNPGAMEAIINWIGEQNSQDWADSLSDELDIDGDSDYDGEDETEED